MNYQQRNRAVSECIRQRCAKTARNPEAYRCHAVDFADDPLFIFDRCYCVTLP